MLEVTSRNIQTLSLCETAVHQRLDALHEDAGCTSRDYETWPVNGKLANKVWIPQPGFF